MKPSRVVLFAAASLCAANVFAAPLSCKRGTNCRGLDELAYNPSNSRLSYYNLDSTYTDIKARGFDFVRFSVDLTKYYDSANDRLYTSGSYDIGNVDMLMQKFLNAGLEVHLLMGRFEGGDLVATNTAHKTEFKRVWQLVAEHYKDWPSTVAFELCNEPKGIGYTLNNLFKDAVTQIRKTNPTRLVLWPAGDGSQPWALTQAANPPKFDWITLPANDTNIAVVVHTYAPADFTHQGASWGYDSNGRPRNYHVDLTDAYRAKLREDLTYLSQYVHFHPDVPIVLNEFGVMQGKSYESDAHEWLSTVREYCEAHDNVAWAHFEYTDFNNNTKQFAIRGAVTGESSWRTNVVDALFPKGWDDKPSTYGQLDMDGFSKKLQVSFTGYAGTETLTNFPVLVKLSTAISGFSYNDFQQKSTGGDLRFADSTGRQIPHEIDTWNPNGVSTVWVRVPTLTAATRIYACYGCANPPAVTAMDVWDDDYVGVWHLNEGGLPLYESSHRGPSFTMRNGQDLAFASSGVVGGSVDFGDGMSNSVIAVDHDNLDGFEKFTIEAWTKQSAHKTNAGIFSKTAGNQMSYNFYDVGSATRIRYSDSGTNWTAYANVVSPSTGSWQHQACSVDTTISTGNVKGYLNGASTVTASKASGHVYAGVGYLTLGNLQPASKDYAFNGCIDEVRVSKCVRSADWIRASHDTVTEADFATYTYDLQGLDDPEPQVAEYGPLATNIFSKSMSIRFDMLEYGVALTNFPVLVKLSTAISGFSYADFKKANGGDLRFADPDGNLLPHEIDTWDQSGVSTVWVKIPRLTRNTIISAHYGCAGSVPAVNAKDVWDDDYVGVWHLGESALPMKESSETSSNFTNSYGTTIGYAAQGIVGKAVDFPTNGTYNALVAADHDALDNFGAFTLETWTFQDVRKANAGILAKRVESNRECAYYLYDTGSYVPFCIGTNRNAGARWSFNQTQVLGGWTYIACSANMTNTTKNVHGYLNGTMNGWEPDVTFLGQMGNCASDLYLGNLGANKKDNTFNGKIDEVRISKVDRSKTWIKATYDTITSDSFATYAVGVELEPLVNITNLLLKASTDKPNPIDYVENEDVRFDFWLDGVEALPSAVRAKQPLYVAWTRTADDGVTVKGTNTISLAQGFSVTTKLAIPGIIKMTGTLLGSDYKAISYVNPADGKTKNIAFGGGAGVATEKMQLSSVEPADFDRFWAEAKAKLATVPFPTDGSELTEVFPKTSNTNSYRYYAAKIPCYGPRPVTGWIIMPRNPTAGGIPVQANFDGYGCISKAPSLPTGGVGQKVYFGVNAHGYDMIGHDDQYYQDFNDYINKTNRTFNGTTYTYGLAPQDYDNPTNTYFYYMAMRIMRAFQYLKSRPEWDGVNVIAAGGSQGGLQTMWAGGLVEGITKIQPSITWGCDVGCPFNGNGNPYPSRTWGIPSVPGAFYFDSALHAKRVPRTCIAEITRLGMGDYTCPPRGVLLSYYNMRCQVSAKLVQGSDHGYVPPSPNQVFTISKAAEPAPVNVFASDAAGFDYTNRVVTVTNATEGTELTLTATASDGTTTTATATVDANGEATFDIATTAGTAYTYAVVQGDDTVATGGFFTGGWDADGTLFSAAPDGSGASVEVYGEWTAAPSGTNATHYVVDSGADFGLSADASSATGGALVRVDISAQYDSFDESGDLSIGDLSGRIAGMTAATSGGTAKWMFGSGDGWKPLAGGPVPQTDTPYVLRIEVDFKSAPPKVRCSVSDDGTSFAVLSDEDSGDIWQDATGVSSTALSGVSIDGQGVVASIGGSLANANVAEADCVGYASLSDAIASATNSLVLLTNATWPTNTPVGTVSLNRGGYALQGVTLDGNGKAVVQSGYSAIPGEGRVNITLTQAAALGVATANKTPAQIASALAANGANGIPRWKSYVLGLDPADATAQPKATIVMNGENVELSLVGIDVNDASGATVSYKVYKFSDLANMAAAEAVGGDRDVDTTAEVPKDASAPKMFYRLKVDVKGY